MRCEAECKAHELDEARTRRRALERLVADGEAVLAGHVVWLAGDPTPALVTVKRSILEAEARLQIHRAASERHAEVVHSLRPRLDGLRVLLGEATLLDPPDYSERVRSLGGEREAARGASETVAASSRHAELVDRQLATLRQAPLSEEQRAHLDEHVRWLKAQRERLDAGVDALV